MITQYMGDPHANHLGFLKNSDIVSFSNRNYDQKFEFFQLFQLHGILVEIPLGSELPLEK